MSTQANYVEDGYVLAGYVFQSDDAHLLPPNASAQERALSNATARIADSVPVTIREVWNPDTCPAHLLPWLAWGFSLDNWDDKWTEAQKRAAIKSSYQVHKHKGTAGALKNALDALGLNLQVTEWHQMQPAGDPYTFAVRVDVGQAGLPGENAIPTIEGVIDSTKNLRSHLASLNITGTVPGSEYLAAALFCGETVFIKSTQGTPPALTQQLINGASQWVPGELD